MALDTYFTMLASGSTATSMPSSLPLFGTYGGLSTLSNDDVVLVNVTASAAPIRVGDGTVTNGTGQRISVGDNFEFPMARAGTASLMRFVRESNDAGALWAIWRRKEN